MQPQLIAGVLLAPSAAIFIYAGIQEYRRYKAEGPATYGLVYCEETGTTHVTGIDDAQDSYNPDDFDPNNYNDRESRPAEETATA